MNINQIGIIIGAFIVILIGVILLNSIADSISELDDVIGLSPNQTFTWPDNNTLTKFDNGEDVITSSVVVYCNYSKLTINQNYTVIPQGVYIINLSSTTNGMGADMQLCVYNMSYNYEGVNYVSDSTARTLIGLCTLFFAVAILFVGYMVVMKSFKDFNF